MMVYIYPAFKLWKEIYGKSMYSEVVDLGLSLCKMRAEFCPLPSGIWLYLHSFSFHPYNTPWKLYGVAWSFVNWLTIQYKEEKKKKRDKYKHERMVSFPLCFHCVSEKKEISVHQEGNCFVTKMVLDCLLGIFWKHRRVTARKSKQILLCE